MKDIAIFGAGGFGREVACLINKINEQEATWNFIGFYDDNPALNGQLISHYGPYLGNMDDLNSVDKELYLIIAIGNPITLKTVVGKISNHNILFPNIIHPNIVYTDYETFKIGKGNIIQANCTMSCNVSIGDFNVLNGSVVLGHDVHIGSFNTLMPAVRVSGEVGIGEANFFGVGSIILQRIKIGNNVRLGAGSVLMKKPKDGVLYLGNPARKVEL